MAASPIAAADTRGLRGRPPYDHHQDPAPQPPHTIRLPTVSVTATSTTPATNQATSPSGTGPTWASGQPPRSSGERAYWTYAITELRSRSGRGDGETRGMRFGPVR